MNFKLVILCVLARSPGRRIALDEVRREVESIIEFGDPGAEMKQTPALDHIDIFEAGLVSRDHAGLQITDLGLWLLRSLDNSSSSPPIVVLTPALRTIDELIGTRERLRIFDLELRGRDSGTDDGADVLPHQLEPASGNEPAAIGSADVVADPEADDLLETIDPQIPGAAGSNPHQWSPDESHQPPAIKPAEPAQDAPAFLRRSFGSRALAPSRTSCWTSRGRASRPTTALSNLLTASPEPNA